MGKHRHTEMTDMMENNWKIWLKKIMLNLKMIRIELDLEQFRRHPLNLNSASEEDLMQLHILYPLQIRNFLSYRKILGALLSII